MLYSAIFSYKGRGRGECDCERTGQFFDIYRCQWLVAYTAAFNHRRLDPSMVVGRYLERPWLTTCKLNFSVGSNSARVADELTADCLKLGFGRLDGCSVKAARKSCWVDSNT